MASTAKIIAYNIEFAKATHPEAIAQHLQAENPDIICFSEVPNGDWTARVGQCMGMNYSYVGTIASANHEKEYLDKTGKYYGKFKSILSKTPVTDLHEELLEGTGWSPVSIVFARTIINDMSLLIGSLHIPSGIGDPANSCAANLAKLINSYQDERIIICGDYNDLAKAVPLQILYRQSYKNAWLETNYILINQKTCNAKNEESYGVIDHFLYKGSLKAVKTDIIKSGIPQSDHYAITMNFLLK